MYGIHSFLEDSINVCETIEIYQHQVDQILSLIK